MHFECQWNGKIDSIDAKGTIKVKEFSNDNLEFKVEMDSLENDDTNKVLAFVSSDLVPLFKQTLDLFLKDLTMVHGDSLKVRVEEPAIKVQHEPIKGTTNESAIATTTIEQESEFFCTAQDLFDTLTSPQRMAAWTRGSAKLNGNDFVLFDGNISGTFTKLESPHLIEAKWRAKSWPSSCISKVVIELKQGSDFTTLKLRQTGVPRSEENLTFNNWNNYYWNSIKQVFGFGAFV